MRIIGIIPARMESSRYPGKPLARIHGIPMVGHCYLRSKMCPLMDEVYVATCNEEVMTYIESIHGKAIMTANTHERASDRAAEAMLKAEQMLGYKVDIVVMIQGDEPMLTPEMLTEAIQPMRDDPSIQVLNLMGEIATREEHDDPNEVKVVVDNRGDALYFSREPIPSWKKSAKYVRMLKQICLIPFRRDYLLNFNSLPQTPLEIAESVDMLRVLEHGEKVRMVETKANTYSVDTPEDLRDVEEAMRGDNLMARYWELRDR
jgi:3-deoxy-manno-octulosonate cytidylyltransferase (CMP-KDO synthetase)